jgi:hypothetical protein
VNKKLVVLAMGLALLMTAAAHAQTIHLKVNVPFSFTAGGVTLPAGNYDVLSEGNGDKVLSIRDFRTKAGALVLSNSCESLRPSLSSKLIFHRYGQRYFLSEVWVQGNTLGHQVPAGSREVEIAKDSSMDQVILAAK